MATLWKVGVVLLLIVTLLPALSLAWSDHSRSTYAVSDETMIVDYDEPVSVNTSAPEYNDSVTITADGTPLVAGTDYSWNASNGTVAFVNTSATVEGDQSLIDYEYAERTQETRLVGNVLTPWGTILSMLAVFGLVVGGYNFAVGGGRGL